jgi:hypothetical protein
MFIPPRSRAGPTPATGYVDKVNQHSIVTAGAKTWQGLPAQPELFCRMQAANLLPAGAKARHASTNSEVLGKYSSNHSALKYDFVFICGAQFLIERFCFNVC